MTLRNAPLTAGSSHSVKDMLLPHHWIDLLTLPQLGASLCACTAKHRGTEPPTAKTSACSPVQILERKGP